MDRDDYPPPRSWMTVDPVTFEPLLSAVRPEFSGRVRNAISDDGTTLSIHLRFDRIEDFDPTSIARQIAPLEKLLETRDRLVDLQQKLGRNADLDRLINEVLRGAARKGDTGVAPGEGPDNT
jgi:type VI secretion system protein ImpB